MGVLGWGAGGVEGLGESRRWVKCQVHFRQVGAKEAGRWEPKRWAGCLSCVI